MPKPSRTKKRKHSQSDTGCRKNRPESRPDTQAKPEWTPTHHHREDQKLASIHLPSSAVNIALSPDDKFAAVIIGERQNAQAKLQIYCVESFLLVETVQVGSGHFFGLSFAPSSPHQNGYMVAVSKTCGGAMLWYFDDCGRLRDPADVSQDVDRTGLYERLGQDIISVLIDYYNKEANETRGPLEGITNTLREAFELGQREHKIPYRLGGDKVIFSPDGTFLITAIMYDPVSTSNGAPLVLWDLRTRVIRHIIPCVSSKIWWVSISPDSRLIAFGESDTSVQIWDSQTGSFIPPLKVRGAFIRHGVFSPDSAHIALLNRPGDSDASVFVHGLAGGKRDASLQQVANCSEPISWNHDGTLLAVLRAENEISLWDPFTSQRPTRMEWSLPSYTHAYPNSIQFTDQGRKLMLVSASGATDVYDMLSLTLHRFPGETGTVRNALCARDGSFLAVREGKVLTFGGSK
ncbi:hypothetical protein ASPVEDRAFT_86390 [Aspergillus versicolor CBS 583.65]|uniref:Uncharacterized protein n=1 Tax=Aspergillus versicolor CBS 583.65 TaxID=1036611 RepID=A0A1L9PUD6_ASPVE|nr:uncharacterized protein ASPVEDRAFT_86390 [Aspergillus versicolor CBS 583.65]OJJ05026.1 hypothetical protein ASPVEDRAFT_86390 [Aspergillus versicolor CBS 583.65]